MGIPGLVPIGRRYTATLTKSATKSIVCEGCKKDFTYEATREAQGFGDSWLWLDNEGAEKRALTSAERNCEKVLAKAVDITPCPHCHWYQRNMVVIGKRKRLLYTWAVGFAVSWCVLFGEFFGAQGNSMASGGKATAVFWAFIAIGTIWFFAYNPNRGKNRR